MRFAHALLLLLFAAGLTGCASSRPRPQPGRCVPSCARDASCASLDDRLIAARKPLLSCIRRAGAAMDVGRTHRCFRALRLLESGRWWLRTLESHLSTAPPVYATSIASIRREFYCRLERLAEARTPEQVQRRYIEMVRAYP